MTDNLYLAHRQVSLNPWCYENFLIRCQHSKSRTFHIKILIFCFSSNLRDLVILSWSWVTALLQMGKVPSSLAQSPPGLLYLCFLVWKKVYYRLVDGTELQQPALISVCQDFLLFISLRDSMCVCMYVRGGVEVSPPVWILRWAFRWELLVYTLLHPAKSHWWIRLLFKSRDSSPCIWVIPAGLSIKTEIGSKNDFKV